MRSRGFHMIMKETKSRANISSYFLIAFDLSDPSLLKLMTMAQRMPSIATSSTNFFQI